MSALSVSKLCRAGVILVSLAVVPGAIAQPVAPPDFSAGNTGWVHDGGATFPPVEGAPSPVVQDPAHPFISQAASWRIGDLSNPNLKPWVKEVMKKDNDEIHRGKIAFQARSSCVPSGIPNMFLPGNGLHIIQTPTKVVMFKQGNWELRHIYLNVPHSANVKPSWYGESVGHYEGDTLVVDTIGQNTKTFVDAFRTPHTEKLHVVERWRLIDGGKGLEVKITVDDPDAFNQAWSTYVHHERARVPLVEDICAENNMNLFDYHMPVAETPDF